MPTGAWSWTTCAAPWRCWWPVFEHLGPRRSASVSQWRSPSSLAHWTRAQDRSAARWLWDTIDRPNLLVKIPATAAGVPAIQTMISEGRSINITLIFSLDRYADVIEAYLSGLETLAAAGGDLAPVNSVASFFVSRVDTEVDRRLEALGSPGALGLRGKAAVAQAQLAYELFSERFSGPRWEALAAQGASVQRPLWASTSTKNPQYPDLLYVDNLIGPNTVNTMPDATIDAFLDHGTLACTVDADSLQWPTRCSTSWPRWAWIWLILPRSSRTRGWPPFPRASTSSSRP